MLFFLLKFVPSVTQDDVNEELRRFDLEVHTNSEREEDDINEELRIFEKDIVIARDVYTCVPITAPIEGCVYVRTYHSSY